MLANSGKEEHRGMDLIIKPTESCNFSCTFCSSTYLIDNKKIRLQLELVFDFLKRFPETETIIVNGGDPTMMPVGFYWDLIQHLEEKNYKAKISITTNLWKFWQEWQEQGAKLWTQLFCHPKIGVSTSFQYGEGRQITPGRVFSEEDFIKISDLMLEKVGYRPSFIAVVEKKDLHLAIENVRLAKRLGVDCKLNYMNQSGDSKEPLPLAYIYKVYLQIIAEGLENHEWNTRQMANRLLKTKSTSCPLFRGCDESIRVLQPDGKYFSCGAFGDDLEYEIDFEKEVRGNNFFTPLREDPELDSLKEECYSCQMFQICNGCHKHIKDLKKSDKVEEHCKLMKSIADEILEVNLKSEIIIENDSYFETAK